MKNPLLPLLLTALCCALGSSLDAQPPDLYAQEMQSWHEKRIADLKAPDGWLNLVGLYWLQEGRNSFGSGAGNTIVFPAGTIAVSAGYFQRAGDKVEMVVAGQAGVTIEGRAVNEAVIFDGVSFGQPVVAIGSLRFSIIKREDKLGVRLRDLNSPLLRSFTDIAYFPLDTEWRISAVLQQPAEVAGQIAITNILGQTSRQHSPGTLVFTYRGIQYSLETLEEGEQLFIVFGDGTNGRTTYHSGRFLQVPKPAAGSNRTVIDFNKAYNPPCAFTAFATCPLPPKENVLRVNVDAGEKMWGH